MDYIGCYKRDADGILRIFGPADAPPPRRHLRVVNDATVCTLTPEEIRRAHADGFELREDGDGIVHIFRK